MAQRFNIRVYGIWIHEHMLLVNEELINGNKVVKLPGGGLEFGEGAIDCLKREWREELALDIAVTAHFYTTDFYQPSAFDDSQVISIYYLVHADAEAVIVNHVPGEYTYWLPLKDISSDTFSLPIDKIVGDMLSRQFTKL